MRSQPLILTTGPTETKAQFRQIHVLLGGAHRQCFLMNTHHNFHRYAITQFSSSSSTWFSYIHLLFLGLELLHCKYKNSAVTITWPTTIPIDALQQIRRSESWVLSAFGRLKSSCSYVFMPCSTDLRRYAHIFVLCMFRSWK
jgi:hypothetical protein